MTTEQAIIWNMAIDAAAKAHHKGLGAILQLKRKFAVTVEHVGTTTKQEVEAFGNDANQSNPRRCDGR